RFRPKFYIDHIDRRDAQVVHLLDVTDAAVKGIESMMKESGKAGSLLRIYAAGMSCHGIQYAIAYEEKVHPDDKQIEVKGVKFVMDEYAEKDLAEAVLDFVETEKGSGLVFNMPRTAGCKSGCSGCG
ncbi:MAG: iron-sulfur cluster assembly accessory protein, partial [Bacteroidales bacterium]